jgi:cytohesin
MSKKLTNLMLIGITLSFAALICGCSVNTQIDKSSSKHDGVIYRNPRVYNVEYSFEMFPDPNKVELDKDLKLWIPIPREWDSQKAVKIVSVEPEPHGKYVDPEYGNPMLFWDFGKEPEKASYKVNLKFRSEQYDVHSNIDPNRVGPYDKTSKDYALYTRSTNTVVLTDKVRTLAKIAVGDVENPYLQAKQIYELVREKMYYRGPDWQEKIDSIETILGSPVIDPKTGQEHYNGVCYHHSLVFVALCRAVGIPARNVIAFWDYSPWNQTTAEHREPTIGFRELSIKGLAISSRLGLGGHGWAEIYLHNYGWIPVDPTFGCFGNSNVNNRAVIITKGRDVQIDPEALKEGNGDYRVLVGTLLEGRAVFLLAGVFHASTIRSVTTERFNHPDPFPADTLAEYLAILYPEAEAKKNLALYRKRALRWIDENTQEHADKIGALAQAYEKDPRARYEHEAFICHMLRKIVGDKRFFEIVEIYTNLRVKSGEPVSTAHFQEIAEDVYGQPLGWFFKQWIGYSELPQLQLDGVTFSKNKKGWYVRGNLHQLNKSLFRMPVELVLKTEKTTEHKALWAEERNTYFEFRIANKPEEVLVDPDNNILQIRVMPPLLESSYDEIAFCTITDQGKADLYNWTPLHFAAQAGQTDVVEYLIAAGADVDAENIRGETPIQLAAGKHHKEMVGLLIEHGADISLHTAVRLGELDTVMSLIEDVNDINVKDARSRTSLSYAAEEGHTEIAELLLAKGADVNMRGKKYPPLSWAVWDENRDMIKLLVTSGADVNFVAEDDWPYLHYVVSNNDRELVELLLTYGAKLNVKDENGWTEFRIAVSSVHRDLVEFLVSKGAEAPEFHLAACLGNLDSVTSLVENGMDVDTKDELGWTPLYWAASTAQEEVAEFLISKGADIDIKTNNNRTLLHQAALSGATKLIELLIADDADSNARDEDDSTPLHSAATGGHKNVVELLIAKGASLNARDGNGRTPLWYAQYEGHTEIIELLKKHGAKE